MLGQTFAFTDLFSLFFLIFLEILLSADNAVVLGFLTQKLPEHLRKKALYIGFLSAIFLRALALILLVFFIHLVWVQILGGLYLIYLSYRHFFSSEKKKKSIAHSFASFGKTVLMIECFDFLFAIDSILAGVAFITPSVPSHGIIGSEKLWIVYLGGIIGAFAMRYAALLFAKLLHRFPRLEKSAHLMIGWIGLELLVHTFNLSIPYLPVIFWTGLILFFLTGFLKDKDHE